MNTCFVGFDEVIELTQAAHETHLVEFTAELHFAKSRESLVHYPPDTVRHKLMNCIQMYCMTCNYAVCSCVIHVNCHANYHKSSHISHIWKEEELLYHIIQDL